MRFMGRSKCLGVLISIWLVIFLLCTTPSGIESSIFGLDEGSVQGADISRAQQIVLAEQAILIKDTCKIMGSIPDKYYADLYIIKSTCSEKRMAIQICYLENRLWDERAKNPTSPASGLCQYMPSTWRDHKCEGSIWSGKAQLQCAITDIQKGRIKQWEVTKLPEFKLNI